MVFKFISTGNVLVMMCIVALTGCVSKVSRFNDGCKSIEGLNEVSQCVYDDHKGGSVIYGIKNMPYALCSKAICTYDSGSQVASCVCSVQDVEGWKLLSVGPSGYVSAKPTWDSNHNLQTLQSNYSKANVDDFAIPSSTACHFDEPRPWANCFGVRCNVETLIVNGESQQVAICECPVVQSKDFVIGYSDESYCHQPDNKAISATFSGNVAKSGNKAISDMYQKYYPKSPPVCQNK